MPVTAVNDPHYMRMRPSGRMRARGTTVTDVRFITSFVRRDLLLLPPVFVARRCSSQSFGLFGLDGGLHHRLELRVESRRCTGRNTNLRLREMATREFVSGKGSCIRSASYLVKRDGVVAVDVSHAENRKEHHLLLSHSRTWYVLTQ